MPSTVMGIDHVGVGTDFDGDGTVRGMCDASEMINFTLHLLRRKYSERDIEKILGSQLASCNGKGTECKKVNRIESSSATF